jgi:hypothetical protein
MSFSKRNRNDASASKNKQDSPEEMPVLVAAALSVDYAAISTSLVALDEQVGAFTKNMDRIVQQAPAFTTLTTLWEEQAKATVAADAASADNAQLRSRVDAVSAARESEATILRDEVKNQNDPVIFI